jgi:hypothetical protein
MSLRNYSIIVRVSPSSGSDLGTWGSLASLQLNLPAPPSHSPERHNVMCKYIVHFIQYMHQTAFPQLDPAS